MTEKMSGQEVLVSDLVGTAVPQDEPEVTRKSVVAVWAIVESLNGETFPVRFVRESTAGKQFVYDLRKLGIVARWYGDFSGKRMSTKAQIRALYAYAKSRGYSEPATA